MSTTLSARDRLRMRSGKVPSVGSPVDGIHEDGVFTDDPTFVPSKPPTRPGVFIASDPPASAPAVPSPHVPEVSVAEVAPSAMMTATERLRRQTDANTNRQHARKEMATMKTLTGLLGAVFTRPGSLASDEERMSALSVLASKTYELGTVIARIAGDDADRSGFVRAMAMQAAVPLVCKAWEQDREIDWDTLIEVAADMPEVERAAEVMAEAIYRPVQSRQDVSDRLAISMHAAFWQVYTLGKSVDGITPKLAAGIVRDCANYLHARDKFVADNDLHVTWMQGSIGRMTDLVCAEIEARFRGEPAPTQEDIDSVLAVSRSGFEGVENYAQSILEKANPHPVARPADR